MKDIDGYVLAGGLSSRMGRPKADVVLRGKTLLERAIATLSQFTGSAPVLVIRSRSQINFRVAERIETIEDDAGPDDPRAPIFGVRAALKRSDTEWAAILAVDLPFATVDLLREMSASRGEGVDAVVASQPGGMPQVLCGLYRCAAMSLSIDEAIDRGDLSVRGSLPAGRTLLMEFGLTKDGVDPLSNLNTDQDLQEAERFLSKMPS